MVPLRFGSMIRAENLSVRCWWASSSYRCSTAGYKCLSPINQWLSWNTKQNNKKLFCEGFGRKLIEVTTYYWGSVFVHCIRKHTKYSPFKLLYNREPVLVINVKYKLSSTESSDPDEPFDKNIFDPVLAFSNVIGEEVHRQTGENIKRAQKKQHRDYESRNKSSAFNDIYISAEVLLRNNKRKDRKGGKFTFMWLGTYVVSDITKKGLVTLKNKNDKELKKNHNKG